MSLIFPLPSCSLDNCPNEETYRTNTLIPDSLADERCVVDVQWQIWTRKKQTGRVGWVACNGREGVQVAENNIRGDSETGQCCLLVLLDLIAALDTGVDHSIRINKPRYRVDTSGSALQWFPSCLCWLLLISMPFNLKICIIVNPKVLSLALFCLPV